MKAPSRIHWEKHVAHIPSIFLSFPPGYGCWLVLTDYSRHIARWVVAAAVVSQKRERYSSRPGITAEWFACSRIPVGKWTLPSMIAEGNVGRVGGEKTQDSQRAPATDCRWPPSSTGQPTPNGKNQSVKFKLKHFHTFSWIGQAHIRTQSVASKTGAKWSMKLCGSFKTVVETM